MELKFPSFSEYQSALQNPQICFIHYPLTNGKIELDLWGLPRVRSGGFALTYKMMNHNRKMAVRCFYRGIPDRMQRYFAISQFIETCGSRSLIPVRYLSRGIHIQGRYYPITYMDWVESTTLDEWLVKNHASKTGILKLVEEFKSLVYELESLQIAHGDLSHRNLLYDGKKAVLIDYDGMYVPSLNGKKACELGNPYFQHPGRKKDFFNAEIDRFSEIVICLALTAIALQPDLYQRFETGGEGLLFTKKDFQYPYQSAVMQEIESIPELKVQIQSFREICLGDIRETPRLEDFLRRETFEQERSEVNGVLEDVVSLHPIFAAEERKAIVRREGKIIQVIGQVTEVFWGKEIEGQPHIFINFGSWKKKCFTIVLWDEPLKDFLENGSDPNSLQEKWISVTGLLTTFNHRPQISLTSLSEMTVLEDAKAASERLGRPVAEKEVEAGEKVQAKIHEKQSGWVQAELPVIVSTCGAAQSGVLDRSEEVIERIDQLYRRPRAK
jgi:ABC-type transporter Mla MlaB component